MIVTSGMINTIISFGGKVLKSLSTPDHDRMDVAMAHPTRPDQCSVEDLFLFAFSEIG
jgi:hypothetical protein